MSGTPRAVDLRVEGRRDPIGLDEQRPLLSWRVELARPATRQASFAIEVASRASFRSAAMVWTRTDVVAAHPWIAYDGPSPGSRERRFWRVRLLDDRGAAGPWRNMRNRAGPAIAAGSPSGFDSLDRARIRYGRLRPDIGAVLARRRARCSRSLATSAVQPVW